MYMLVHRTLMYNILSHVHTLIHILRYGCSFWVEHQMRMNGKYMLSEKEICLHESMGNLVIKRRQEHGPKEYRCIPGNGNGSP